MSVDLDQVATELDRMANGLSGSVPLANRLRAVAQGLGQPVRLAVVGPVKRGKSTLVNALLREPVASVGVLETTYTVNELYYADSRRLRVSYRDGRPDDHEPRLVHVRCRDRGGPALLPAYEPEGLA